MATVSSWIPFKPNLEGAIAKKSHPFVSAKVGCRLWHCVCRRSSQRRICTRRALDDADVSQKSPQTVGPVVQLVQGSLLRRPKCLPVSAWGSRWPSKALGSACDVFSCWVKVHGANLPMLFP